MAIPTAQTITCTAPLILYPSPQLATAHGVNPTDLEFELSDLDGDKKVSLEEWDTIFFSQLTDDPLVAETPPPAEAAPPSTEPPAADAGIGGVSGDSELMTEEEFFHASDLDSDGKLNKKEFYNVRARLHRRPRFMRAECFAWCPCCRECSHPPILPCLIFPNLAHCVVVSVARRQSWSRSKFSRSCQWWKPGIARHTIWTLYVHHPPSSARTCGKPIGSLRFLPFLDSIARETPNPETIGSLPARKTLDNRNRMGKRPSNELVQKPATEYRIAQPLQRPVVTRNVFNR